MDYRNGNTLLTDGTAATNYDSIEPDNGITVLSSLKKTFQKLHNDAAVWTWGGVSIVLLFSIAGSFTIYDNAKYSTLLVLLLSLNQTMAVVCLVANHLLTNRKKKRLSRARTFSTFSMAVWLAIILSGLFL